MKPEKIQNNQVDSLRALQKRKSAVKQEIFACEEELYDYYDAYVEPVKQVTQLFSGRNSGNGYCNTNIGGNATKLLAIGSLGMFLYKRWKKHKEKKCS